MLLEVSTHQIIWISCRQSTFSRFNHTNLIITSIGFIETLILTMTVGIFRNFFTNILRKADWRLWNLNWIIELHITAWKKFIQTTNFEEITDKLDSNKIFSEIKLKTIKWHGDESLTHYLSDELIVGYRPTFWTQCSVGSPSGSIRSYPWCNAFLDDSAITVGNIWLESWREC